MNLRYKEMLPAWTTFTNENYGLILSGDIDSLASCCLLQTETNWRIKALMLHYFNKYKIEKLGADESPLDYFGVLEKKLKFCNLIGVALALVRGKCFDNHLQLFDADMHPNPKSANLNNIFRINREIYEEKYAASTFLLLWSLFEYPDENLTDELKMLLLSIDIGFKGYYNETFKPHFEHYFLDVLKLPNLYDFLSGHTMTEFYDFHNDYNLGRKLFLDDNGYLDTNIRINEIQKIFSKNGIDIGLKLPEEQFHHSFYCHHMKSTCEPTENDIFTLSLTGKNEYKYSIRFSEEEEKKARTA